MAPTTVVPLLSTPDNNCLTAVWSWLFPKTGLVIVLPRLERNAVRFWLMSLASMARSISTARSLNKYVIQGITMVGGFADAVQTET